MILHLTHSLAKYSCLLDAINNDFCIFIISGLTRPKKQFTKRAFGTGKHEQIHIQSVQIPIYTNDSSIA